MPTAVEHDISVNVDPFTGGGHQRVPDIHVMLTGLPTTVDVGHEHTSAAADLSFTLTGGTLDLKIELLVPAVQHTDFLLG